VKEVYNTKQPGASANGEVLLRHIAGALTELKEELGTGWFSGNCPLCGGQDDCFKVYPCNSYGMETVEAFSCDSCRESGLVEDFIKLRFYAAPPKGRARTELGNSERLIARHGEDLRYFHGWRKWFVYDGKRWCLDDGGVVKEKAKDTTRAIYEEAAAENDTSERKALADHAKRSESRQRVEAMISLAESSVPVQAEELDANPWLLNVKNGTVDLTTGKLLEHRRENMITKLAPVEYDPAATAPTFEAFLERILPSEALRRFVQRAVGYAAIGIVSEEILTILCGVGANGKSTLANVLMDALGDYAIQAAPELLLAKRGAHPTELADLFGARFVASVEVDEGRRLAESLVKQLTGRDPIKARRMREDFWQFDPTHTVFLATNHRPEIRGTDHAIWRRIKLVPFEVTIPEGEQDKWLAEKLRKELPGILAWIVRGCLEYQRDGLGEPDEVTAATEGYRADQDVLAAFINECCVVRPDVWCKFADLYAAYTSWCEESNEHPEKKRRFGDSLTERGFERDNGAKNVAVRRGIALRQDGGPDPAKVNDPTPKSGPKQPDTAPSEGEKANPGVEGLMNDNPQNTCKTEDSGARVNEGYRESDSPGDFSSRGGNAETSLTVVNSLTQEGDVAPPLGADRLVSAVFDEDRGGAKNLPLYLAGRTTLRILTNSVLEALHRPWQQMSEIEHRRWERLVENAARQRAENEKGA